MTILDMLGQSGILTVLGMGVVFAFIIILVFAMSLLKVVVKSLKLDQKEVAASAAQSVSAGQDTAVIAAIAAAVREK